MIQTQTDLMIERTIMMIGNKQERIKKLAKKHQSAKIAEYLKSRDKDVRLAAIVALGESGGEDAFNNLTLILSSAAPAERMAAAQALGVLGDEKAISYLSHQLAKEQDAALINAFKKGLHALHKG
jgi:HEAT repeat protein